MERKAKHNRLSRKHVRRQVTVFALAAAGLISAAHEMPHVLGDSNSPVQAESGPAKPDDQITIGTNGDFPSLPAAVIEIGAQNPSLDQENIREQLSGKVNTELKKLNVSPGAYNQFRPGLDKTVTVDTPANWEVKKAIEQERSDSGTANPQ